jgi:DNA-binding transcriptional regulator LsrR (DeoR family)
MNKKLTMRTIEEIRRLYKTGKYKQAYLAFLYQVSSTQISRIVTFKRRKNG